MGRQIDRSVPTGHTPVNTVNRQQWGIDRGINRQIKIDHGINRKIVSHEQSWEFLGNGCPGCPYPWGTGQVGLRHGLSSESTFLCVYIRPWSLDRSRSQDRASMPTMSHRQGRRHGIDSPLIVIWDMIRTGGRVSTNPVGNGVAKSA